MHNVLPPALFLWFSMGIQHGNDVKLHLVRSKHQGLPKKRWLLMEQILHQFRLTILFHYLQGLKHQSWVGKPFLSPSSWWGWYQRCLAQRSMIRVAEKVTSRKKKTDFFLFASEFLYFFFGKGMILQIGGNMINYDQIIFFGWFFPHVQSWVRWGWARLGGFPCHFFLEGPFARATTTRGGRSAKRSARGD